MYPGFNLYITTVRDKRANREALKDREGGKRGELIVQALWIPPQGRSPANIFERGTGESAGEWGPWLWDLEAFSPVPRAKMLQRAALHP